MGQIKVGSGHTFVSTNTAPINGDSALFSRLLRRTAWRQHPPRNDGGSGHGGMTIVAQTSGVAGIYMGDNADPDAGRLIYENTNHAWAFSTADTEQMRIDTNGNVGIGLRVRGKNLQ